MTSILINNPKGVDTSTVSSCGGMHSEEALSVCCLSPTVPDLCCSARMPWHLPDTIVPSCLERWRQCGMILKGIWVLEMHRKKMQFPARELVHNYSIFILVSVKETSVPNLVLCKPSQLNYKRTECRISHCVFFFHFMLGNSQKVKTPEPLSCFLKIRL